MAPDPTDLIAKHGESAGVAIEALAEGNPRDALAGVADMVQPGLGTLVRLLGYAPNDAKLAKVYEREKLAEHLRFTFEAVQATGLAKITGAFEERLAEVIDQLGRNDRAVAAETIAEFKRLQEEFVARLFTQLLSGLEEVHTAVMDLNQANRSEHHGLRADLQEVLRRLPPVESGSLPGKLSTGYEVDPDRQHRLIQDLESNDARSIERAISVLKVTRSPWLIDKLRPIIAGADRHLAQMALSALREIPGVSPASAIAAALTSVLPEVRSEAAFNLGEMALFGRREDALRELPALIELAEKCDDPASREAVHSVGKIGGEDALKCLVRILGMPKASAEIRAQALHAPGRFWVPRYMNAFQQDPTTRSDKDLFRRFLVEAREAVRGWSPEERSAVNRTSLFKYADDETRKLLSKTTP